MADEGQYNYPHLGRIIGEVARELKAEGRTQSWNDAVDAMEATLRHRVEMPTVGSLMIVHERARQISDEGYSAGADDIWVGGELVDAAEAYITDDKDRALFLWPWSRQFFKPGNRVGNLVKAGALIAAEIDRLIRKGEV